MVREGGGAFHERAQKFPVDTRNGQCYFFSMMLKIQQKEER